MGENSKEKEKKKARRPGGGFKEKGRGKDVNSREGRKPHDLNSDDEPRGKAKKEKWQGRESRFVPGLLQNTRKLQNKGRREAPGEKGGKGLQTGYRLKGRRGRPTRVTAGGKKKERSFTGKRGGISRNHP